NVYVLNDPEEGGMHLPDIFMFKPVFDAEGLLGFVVCIQHYPEIGGRAPGGNAVDSTEIFQEGLQIPALKLYDRGRPNETLLRILAKNVRIPDIVLGDLRAQEASCHVGEAGLLKLARRYGRDVLTATVDDILDYTEQMVRAELAQIPDGRYEFEDH